MQINYIIVQIELMFHLKCDIYNLHKHTFCFWKKS